MNGSVHQFPVAKSAFERAAPATPEPGQTRPRQIFLLLGGGNWIRNTTVQLDFLHHVIGKPIAKMMDDTVAVSAGSIVGTALNLPRHAGSTEPKYENCIDIRNVLHADSKAIFRKKPVEPEIPLPDLLRKTFGMTPKKPVEQPEDPHEGSNAKFFNKRIVNDIKTGVSQYALNVIDHQRHNYTNVIERVSNTFDPYRVETNEDQQKPNRAKSFAKSFIRAVGGTLTGMPDMVVHSLTEKFRFSQLQASEKLGHTVRDLQKTFHDYKTGESHFDHRVLWRKLRQNYMIDLPHTNGAKRPARMDDLIGNVTIPAIRHDDNQWVRFTARADKTDFNKLDDVDGKMFTPKATAASAVMFSSLQPTMFIPTKNRATGHEFSDGSTIYGPREAVDDVSTLRGKREKFALTIFDCSMDSEPNLVGGADMARASLPEELSETIALHRNTAHAHDIRQLTKDPNCSRLQNFEHPQSFLAPSVPHGPLHDEMQDFTKKYLNRDYDECLQTNIPKLGAQTQAATSNHMQDMFEAAGVKAVARQLPELVNFAKYLIDHGPLSESMTREQRQDLKTNIDTRFPPKLLTMMVQERKHHAADPHLVPPVTLFERTISSAAVSVHQSASPV